MYRQPLSVAHIVPAIALGLLVLATVDIGQQVGMDADVAMLVFTLQGVVASLAYPAVWLLQFFFPTDRPIGVKLGRPELITRIRYGFHMFLFTGRVWMLSAYEAEALFLLSGYKMIIDDKQAPAGAWFVGSFFALVIAHGAVQWPLIKRGIDSTNGK